MTEALVDRLPPQNLEAEKSVLGACLLSADALDDVATVLQPSHFYAFAHQQIFEAITALRQEAIPIDAISLSERLEQLDCLEDIGGPTYIHELLEAVPHTAHASYYAGIVRERHARREVVNCSSLAIRKAYDDAVDTDELLADAEQSLHGVIESRLAGNQSTDLSSVLMAVFDKLQADAPVSLPIGYPDLQEKLGGWYPGNLVVLGARPSVGKTAFALNLALKALEFSIPTLFFSLEMTRLELAERILAIRAEVCGHKIRANELSEDERHSLLHAANQINNWPLWIDDTAPLSIAQLASAARLKVRQKGVKLIIVDYLQLIRGTGKREHREQEIAEITRTLKALSKSLGVTVIALAQLNRKIEERLNKRPMLSDLRESGAIEQDADIVLLLDRPGLYSSAHGGIAKIQVDKHRNGPTGDVTFVWIPETLTFQSAAADWLQQNNWDAGQQ